MKRQIEEIEEKIKKSHKDQQRRDEQQAIENIKQNTRYFFSYANKKLKTTSAVGPLISQNGTLTGEPKEMSEILRKQYESVFSKANQEKLVSNPQDFFEETPNTGQQLTNIIIRETDIIAAIDEMAADAAAGPDGFHPQLLKRCKVELANPLKILWTESLATGTVPGILKTGIITPIYKGGNRGTPSQYRPVVLTSHLIKICERVIRKQIVEYLEINNLFNEGQHGFRQNRSCLSQLLVHYEGILRCIQEGNNADVIYLDFAKAFDKVDHGILLHKLRSYGIHGQLGKWLHSFLSQRKQRVSVHGEPSEPSTVQSGVPQGSVLGPLLFLIHVGDIDKNLKHSEATSFADDTRIRKKTRNENETTQLQQDLDRIISWASENNMALNRDKFELLRYGNNMDLKERTAYLVSSHTIQDKDHVKDLGVHMSSDASFTYHYNIITNAARQMSGWVLRTFETREEKCMITLWKTMILPKLEYCCQLWSPHTITDITNIEAMQRTYTNKIRGVENMTYWERLRHLKLYSLQRRRERYITIYVWKILEGIVPNVGLIENTHPRRGRLCFVRTTQGATQRVRTIVHNSFTYNGTRTFNCLPR